jgi:hypothetical protein
MRILGILVALQCAGIAFLVYRSVAGDATPAPGPAIPVTVAGAAAPAGPAMAATPGEERLRQIIREELAALAAPGSPGARAAVAAAPRDPERDRARREQVAAQIAHFRSVGRISEPEMAALQHDIAQLDPASRTEMLGALTRALNAREIQGQM